MLAGVLARGMEQELEYPLHTLHFNFVTVSTHPESLVRLATR